MKHTIINIPAEAIIHVQEKNQNLWPIARSVLKKAFPGTQILFTQSPLSFLIPADHGTVPETKTPEEFAKEVAATIQSHVDEKMKGGLEELTQAIDRTNYKQDPPNPNIPHTPLTQQLLANARNLAIANGHSYVGTEHITMALLNSKETPGRELLTLAGASTDPEAIADAWSTTRARTFDWQKKHTAYLHIPDALALYKAYQKDRKLTSGVFSPEAFNDMLAPEGYSKVVELPPLPPIHHGLTYPRDARQLDAIAKHLIPAIRSLRESNEEMTVGEARLEELRHFAREQGTTDFELLDCIIRWSRIPKMTTAQRIEAVRNSIAAAKAAEETSAQTTNGKKEANIDHLKALFYLYERQRDQAGTKLNEAEFSLATITEALEHFGVTMSPKTQD